MQHSSRAQQDSSPKLLGCSQIFPDGTHSTGSPRSASIEAGLGRPVLVMASASNVTNISNGHLIEAANVGRQCRCRGGARASPPLLAGRSLSDATEPSDRGRSSVRALRASPARRKKSASSRRDQVRGTARPTYRRDCGIPWLDPYLLFTTLSLLRLTPAKSLTNLRVPAPVQNLAGTTSSDVSQLRTFRPALS